MADDGVQIPFLHILASVLAWASAVVNPFIYAFKNRQYQQAFIKVIVCKVTRSNSLSLTLLGCVTRKKFSCFDYKPRRFSVRAIILSYYDLQESQSDRTFNFLLKVSKNRNGFMKTLLLPKYR